MPSSASAHSEDPGYCILNLLSTAVSGYHKVKALNTLADMPGNTSLDNLLGSLHGSMTKRRQFNVILDTIVPVVFP